MGTGEKKPQNKGMSFLSVLRHLQLPTCLQGLDKFAHVPL